MGNDNNIATNGQGAQAEPQGWVEKLVDAYGKVMWDWALDGTLENHARAKQAREDLIQALAVPARTEEGDFITVRDEFAAKAMAGLIAGLSYTVRQFAKDGRKQVAPGHEVVAKQAYQFADAMLAARRSK